MNAMIEYILSAELGIPEVRFSIVSFFSRSSEKSGLGLSKPSRFESLQKSRQHVKRRSLHVKFPTKLHERIQNCSAFERPAGLEILQHAWLQSALPGVLRKDVVSGQSELDIEARRD